MTRLASRTHQVEGTLDAIEYCYDQGWTDGLPVVPPTEERVREFLDYARLDPATIIARIPERDREVSAEKLVVNAVMAGCRKEYLPVVIAAVEAVCDPAFQFNHLASQGSPWPVMIVSGPIVKRIGLNFGIWVLGPGTRANATIGRALSLIVANCADGVTGGLQRGTYGHPGRYGGLCIGENPEIAGWDPLHVERGYERNVSTVTMVSTYPWMATPHFPESDPESILQRVALHISETGFYRGVYPVLLGKHWAEAFVKAGWSKARLNDWMAENTWQSVAELKRRGRWGLITAGAVSPVGTPPAPGDEARRIHLWKDGPDDAAVFDSGSRDRARGTCFVAAGGNAGKTICILSPYIVSTNPVTRVIRTID